MGILFKQETTRLLIEGHNATWYRQKNVLINHLCQIGEGSKMHERAMEEYKKEVIVKPNPEIESKYHHYNLCLVLFNNSYLELTRWHYYSEYVFSYIS